MKSAIKYATILATFNPSIAFLQPVTFSQVTNGRTVSLSLAESSTPESTNVDAEVGKETVQEVVTPAVPKKKLKPTHKEGVFSPIVYFTKEVLGSQQLKEIRAKVISKHSEQIKKFVETADSETGQVALRVLFKMADKNGDGVISKEEMQIAMESLGFDWMDEKQITTIFNKTDKDKSGTIDIDEWMVGAPKTLKTNLVKLAKQNGDDMGLLV